MPVFPVDIKKHKLISFFFKPLSAAFLSIIIGATGLLIFQPDNNLGLFLALCLIITFYTIVWIMFLSNSIIKPLKKLENSLKEFNHESDAALLEVDSRSITASLIDSYNEMLLKIQNMTEEINNQRRSRFSSFIDGQEKERQRLSKELHDSIGQMLIALRLKLEQLNIDESSYEYEIVNQVKGGIDKTLEDVRNISKNLIPPGLKEFGLISALRSLCNDLELPASYTISAEFYGEDKHLNSRIQTYIYRIAQEALSNAIKYSECSYLQLSLSSTHHALSLVVQDNGKGFIFDHAISFRGTGLYNMRQRAKVLGGEFSVVSNINQGTRVWVYIPLSNEKFV